MSDNQKSKIYFIIKDITNGAIVNRVEFDETNMSRLFDMDIKEVRDALRQQLIKKYPPDKYHITETDKPENTETDNKTFRMQASSHALLATNISGIIIGVILLFLLLLIRHLYTLGLFIVGIIIIAVYMTADYIIWKKKGIRTIEVDAGGITLYRGEEKKMERIEASQISDVNIFKKVNRRIVTILLGGEAIRPMPGVTLFKGPKIRIADDSFNSAVFTIFIEKIKQFKP